MDEEEKKKYLKNWQGNSAEAMQNGFNKTPESLAKIGDVAGDAWKSMANLFTGSAEAKKKKESDY